MGNVPMPFYAVSFGLIPLQPDSYDEGVDVRHCVFILCAVIRQGCLPHYSQKPLQIFGLWARGIYIASLQRLRGVSHKKQGRAALSRTALF
jgi:hypothetical protein